MLSKAKLVEGMTLLCEMVGHEAANFCTGRTTPYCRT
jgi:hypothetical protein